MSGYASNDHANDAPPPAPIAEAVNRIHIVMAAGILAFIVGCAMAAASQPGFEVSLGGRVEETGDRGIYLFGLLIAGAASIVLMVPVVAWGVFLGIRLRDRHHDMETWVKTGE